MLIVSVVQSYREQKPSNVYFLPLSEENSREELFSSAGNVLTHRAFHLLRIFCLNETVGIRMSRDHVDDTVDIAWAAAEVLRQCEVAPCICDTSDRHLDLKSSAVSRIGEFQKAFDEKGLNMPPVIMLDGMTGEHEVTYKDGEDRRNEAFIAGELPKLGGMVMISKLVPHKLCGIEGAVHNIGNGLASKKGKIRQLADSIPSVNVGKCYTCRRCLHHCPARAIRMAEKHVEIDPAKCINCGLCVEIAHYGGISYKWNASPAHFQKIMTLHAAGVMALSDRRMVFISYLEPTGRKGRPGLLFSRDPVAIDEVGMEMMAEAGMISDHEMKQGGRMLDIASDAGVGKRDCQIDVVAY